MRVKTFDMWGDSSFNLGLEATFLRAEEAAAMNAAGVARDTGARLGQRAAGEVNELDPFFSREMKAEHLYDPTQLNELLTAAGAGIGAGLGAEQSGLERQDAISGNAASTTKTAQQMARDRMKAAAGVSEGVAAQDVTGAQQLRQQGAAGMSGLYGENLKGQLAAMGQVANDINAATTANQTGWLQQAEGIAKTGAGIAKSFMAPGTPS